MKGDTGEILRALILIILMLIMLTVLYTMSFSESNKRHEIILYETELIRVKNTFILVNRSLGQTWLLSTAQSVFKTTDESMGCGFDVESFGLGKKYWYNYDPSDFKDRSCAGTDCIDPRLPQAEKYNLPDANPRVCYPQKPDVEEMLTKKMKPYLDINSTFELNNVDVNITGIRSIINLTSERVISKTTQRIVARIGNRVIYDDNTTNNNTVFSELSSILESARAAVRSALKFSNNLTNESIGDDYDYAMRYQDLYAQQLGYVPTQSHEFYEDQLKERIEGEFDFALNAKVKTNFNTFELIVPNEEQKKIWGVFGLQDPRQGLVLHYDMSVKFIEGAEADTTTGMDITDYDEIIQNAVEAKTWEFGILVEGEMTTVKYENEDIVRLVKAVIQQESNWNGNAYRYEPAINDASYGLMQIIPLYHPECDVTKIKNFDVEENINCGVNFLNQLMGYFARAATREESTARENIIKFALAGYNSGQGNVDNAISCAGECPPFDICMWDEIVTTHPECVNEITREYVPAVLGYYIYYSGSIETFETGEYYFYDEKHDKFVKRPFVTEIKLQDYVPVIDCKENPYSVDYIARQFYWTEGKADVLCCEFGTPDKQGVLIYTCDLDIPEIGDARLSQGEQVTCFQSDPPLVFQCGPNGFERI